MPAQWVERSAAEVEAEVPGVCELMPLPSQT